MARNLLGAYMLLWSLVNLLRISIGLNQGTGLVGSTLDQGAVLNSLLLPLVIGAAGVWPTFCAGALPVAAMVLRATTNLAKGSFMSNSQMWATRPPHQ